MADPIVITPAPTLTNYSEAPNRRTDSREQFAIKADRRMTEENRFTGEANALAAWMRTTAQMVETGAGTVAEDLEAVEVAAEQVRLNKAASEQAAQTAVSSAETAGAAAGIAVTARNEALTSRNQAETFRNESEQLKQATQALRDQTEAIKVADAIDDTSLEPYQVRSAQNASVGHFRNLAGIIESGPIGIMDFAPIAATDASITLTLPASPLEGQMVMIANMTNRLDHQLAVSTIRGKATGGFLVINEAFRTVTLKFIGGAFGWEIL